MPGIDSRPLIEASGVRYKQQAMQRVLIADDHSAVLEALRLLLKGDGFETVLASSPRAVLDAVRASRFDLIMLDLNYARDTTSGVEGLELLTEIEPYRGSAAVIVMTAWGNVPLAVEAMRRGAVDFIEKPWDNARLLQTVRTHVNTLGRMPAGLAAARDMEVARAVQRRLLPQSQPVLESLDYAGCCLPAGHVGGDYYDFLPLSRDAVGFVVADVSGKGVSAAILMAVLQAHFRGHEPGMFNDLPGVFRTLNRRFLESSPAEHYATAFFGRYCDNSRKLDFVNCGHNPPVLVRASGEIERLDATATVLGLFARWQTEVLTVELRPGDSLLIFSDGVTEAVNESDEQFGEERLIRMLEEKREESIGAIVDEIAAAIHAHQAGAQSDDITVVGLRGK